ncbi:cell division protein ZapA [Falsochrobactrum ovis]|uniref:Cell division protein ZapA n=1 Tax=Falsochrobactrum ovis TaxID=1293442 RepID=A0A364JVT5_9HYPH|nr:cell division protein ZapA [Falsochrobactrum ovis]RAK30007.1 cell division protein ZapA [Falsochrobactrum ovis]
MATVTVIIDGKSYRMACDEGQEEHLASLAARLDQYVTHLKSSFGEIGDLRLTVMAGIMIIDELNEAHKRIKNLESEVETLRRSRDEAVTSADRNDAMVTDMLSEVALRIEQAAARILPSPNS